MTHRRRFHYQRGDHVCGLCSSADELLVVATNYIRLGLERRDRCIYACREADIGTVHQMLRAAGIRVDAEERRGALLVMSHDGYLRHGMFEPERLISALYTALHDALDAGFDGLSVAGDMSWVLHQAPGTERLAEYEARANRLFNEHPATGLCLYQHRTIPAVVVDHALATHPLVGIESHRIVPNPFYEEPDVAAVRTPRAETVQGKMAQLTVPRVKDRGKYPRWH